MKKFKKVYIEITNSCNLSCSFCPKHRRVSGALSPAEFTAIIEKIKHRGDNFYLHVMGEPLSHPHFTDILTACHTQNIKTNITTNGTLLQQQGDIILQNRVRMVSISLHSFEANILNKSLEDYLEQIILFCKKALETDTIVELRLWNMDKESIYDVNKLNFQITNYIETRLGLQFNLPKALEEKFYSEDAPNRRKRNLKLIDNIYLGMAEHFDWPDISASTGAICTGFCYGLRNQIAILSDGTVVPCCLDSNGDIPLGNILDDELDTILSSQRSVDMYNQFSNRKVIEPLCQTCGYMKKFSQGK